MENNWLDKFQEGGQFDGLTNRGFNYNGAWGGQFKGGGKLPTGGLKRGEDYGSKSKPYPSVKSSDFAGGGRSYPIPTKQDAGDAIRLARLHHRPDVIAKVHAKYPDLGKKKQSGANMNYYKAGLDFTPKSISQNGAIITDPLGQYAHPGEITRIPSNTITMKGLKKPLLGISNTGDTKIMQPGQDYKFKGTSVTEYPNFTKNKNNTKNKNQNGGWLDHI